MAIRTAGVPIPSSRRFRLPRDAMLGYLLLAPAILLLLVLVGYPFLTAVVMSLQKKLIGQAAAPFIGLDNYITLLADRTFWIVVRNVLIFAGISVALKLVIGTAVALALNESMPARGIIRSIMILPWALPTLVAVLIWMWMYSDVGGVFNMDALTWHADTDTDLERAAAFDGTNIVAQKLLGNPPAGSGPV